jgi:hypothetical protein
LSVLDAVIKETKRLRLAEARGVAAGLAPEHISPVFLALGPKLIDRPFGSVPPLGGRALGCATS